jgi:hypothetical protein
MTFFLSGIFSDGGTEIGGSGGGNVISIGDSIGDDK